MLSPREDWLKWAETLRRYRVEGIVSWLLEAGRPVAILMAQVFYFGQPFFGNMAHEIGHMLESDEEARAFAALLNGGLVS